MELGKLVRSIEPHGLLSLADQLVCYQSHHHSLFLDQSIGDALGGEAWAVRRKAAFEASRALLSSLYRDIGVTAEKERIELAAELFAAMGHGRLTLELTSQGGTARGEALHFGSSFVEKYGGVVRNRRTLDAFAAGYCSAVASLAYPSDWGAFDAAEVACVGRRDAACSFTLARRPDARSEVSSVGRAAVEALSASPVDEAARAEPTAQSLAASRILSEIYADSTGVLRAFGVRLALIPSSYTNQITYETAHLIEKRAPDLGSVFAALAREAALMGAFHLLAGFLSSPEWEAFSGPPPKDAASRLEHLLSIARSLGWGALYAVDFVPGRTLVLRSRVTPETAYSLVRHGSAARGRLPFQQGLALAIMHILHRLDFSAGPIRLTRDVYNDLFRSGTRFIVEETRSPLRGDDVSEVLVEAIAD